jgi:hypothetical protein
VCVCMCVCTMGAIPNIYDMCGKGKKSTGDIYYTLYTAAGKGNGRTRVEIDREGNLAGNGLALIRFGVVISWGG